MVEDKIYILLFFFLFYALIVLMLARVKNETKILNSGKTS